MFPNHHLLFPLIISLSLFILTTTTTPIEELNKLIPNLTQTEIPSKSFALQINSNSPVEDKYILEQLLIDSQPIYFLAIFDGHGGAELSTYASTHVVSFFTSFYSIQPDCSSFEDKIITSLKESLYKIETTYYDQSLTQFHQGNTKVSSIGTCALISIITKHKIFIANIGDSKSKIYSLHNNQYSITKGNVVHNARKRTEQTRLVNEYPNEPDIYMCVNRKACYVKGRLQTTRSLGDFHLKHKEFISERSLYYSHYKSINTTRLPYVLSYPDIKVFDITKQDEYVVIASDGLWDNVKGWEVGNVLLESKGDVKYKAYSIVSLCLKKVAGMAKMKVDDVVKIPYGKKRRKVHDDITMILFDLKEMKLS